jgi:hypothetical protein
MSKPKSLKTFKLVDTRSAAEKFAALGPLAARHGNFPKGTVLPETTVPACPKIKIVDFPDGFIPTKYFEDLEHNQQIRSCCRHPENHAIEALKSHPDEVAPDIYIFHCTCGRIHRRFCVAQFDENRPYWEAA